MLPPARAQRQNRNTNRDQKPPTPQKRHRAVVPHRLGELVKDVMRSNRNREMELMIAPYTFARLLVIELGDDAPSPSGPGTPIAITGSETGQLYTTDLSPHVVQRLAGLLAWPPDTSADAARHSTSEMASRQLIDIHLSRY
ncbi:hypothetical protein GT755_00125 [Herbidospora sp. NEAU-GS84]|uniref:Uncharacterized protein n=1 Tax=Herbidospora solisilvae TaxID=2696284 RepID=A0A7C9J5D7_9ACTN|nr:hypothetical protein [Herbidospora solisilvae]NAS20088.1 hypothetical protein [Herbidospora solisilvae]